MENQPIPLNCHGATTFRDEALAKTQESSVRSSIAINAAPLDSKTHSAISLCPTSKTPQLQPCSVGGNAVAYPNAGVDCIIMSLSGLLFSYSLSGLKSDPREITELLKITSSERGLWIVVGAHYRRKGLPDAAVSVMHAMLEVMTQRRIPESDLKPAYLLLSGCESDLARKAQQDPLQSTKHHKNSVKWLQKVYGEYKSELPPPPPFSAPTAQRSTSPRFPSEVGPVLSASRGEERDLERELQSLRDQVNHQKSLLASIRASKRRLEDDFDAERNIRRRLERQVDDLKRERVRDIPWHAETPYYRY
ncbi:hypothetical protein VNI00_004034 [Paramarasmius palmivorus]|uniref:Uncharacterized protein n=1 Tax=Paramarasmius palmivorus TaxID=297713 RepID=A0AAW0DN04_9AGAR